MARQSYVSPAALRGLLPPPSRLAHRARLVRYKPLWLLVHSSLITSSPLSSPYKPPESPKWIVIVVLTHFGSSSARYMHKIRVLPWAMPRSIPPTGTRTHHHTSNITFPPFLSKSEFWSLLHAFLERCVHRTVPAPFFYGHDPSPDIQTIPPHLGYPFEAAPTAAMPDTGPFTYIGALPTAGWADPPHQLSQFATSSITTLLDSDRATAVNAVETYGDIINQDTTIGSISNPSNTPVVIEQRRWYSEYSVDRDPNGLFHCPFAGCGKVNKRRDQLWEHWKAKHNDDPYRCGFWSVLQADNHSL